MTVEEWLQWVEKNKKRVNRYELGHDGSDGGCDCIGLPIGAVCLSGIEWKTKHGSNHAARYRILNLHSTSDGYDLGELVFKSREPGDSKWELPDDYRNHPDQRDYYHVGVITKVNPLEITHCTGVTGGIKFDNKIGAWKWAGYLDIVSFEEEGDHMIATVIKAPGAVDAPVNLRTEPNTNCNAIAGIVFGEKVKVLTNGDDWCKISWNGKTGYMMSKFLKVEEEPVPGDTVTLTLPREITEQFLTALENSLRG